MRHGIVCATVRHPARELEYDRNLGAKGNRAWIRETPGAPGQPVRVPTKLTFFRQGQDQVRQLSEVSIDGGKTWTINYDLIYVSRKPVTPASTMKWWR